MSQWRKTLYAAWIGQICSITGFTFVLPFMPFYIEDLGVKGQGEIAMWAGVAAAATALTMAISAPIWGAMADRYGRKRMVLRSMYGGALVLVAMGFSRNVVDLIVLRALQGVLTGTITASVALVSSVTPPKRSGFSLGLMQSAVFCGAAVGPFIGGTLAEQLGFRPTFMIAAIVLIVGGLIVQFLAREEFTPPEPTNDGRFKSLGEIFAAAGFLTALGTLFLTRFANSAFNPVFPLLVQDLHGSAEGAKQVTGYILGLGGLAAAFSAGVLFGRLVDRWGHKRILIASALLAGAATLPLAFVGQIWQVFLLRAIFGFAAAGLVPSANIIIHRIIHEKHLGKAYGITASVTSLGWGLGPLAGGFLAKHASMYVPFILTGGILLATALLVKWRMK